MGNVQLFVLKTNKIYIHVPYFIAVKTIYIYMLMKFRHKFDNPISLVPVI